jgi:hypothetical protein
MTGGFGGDEGVNTGTQSTTNTQTNALNQELQQLFAVDDDGFAFSSPDDESANGDQ